jgi:N-acetylglutamate synthase-like GNAT family acetyltransferase
MKLPKGRLLPAIRRATQSDSLGILDCLREAFEAYCGSYTPDAFADTVLTHDTLQQRFATMSVFVVTSDSGEIVGTIACHAVHQREGHIRGMAVRPAWHGSGVAAMLLKSAESELRETKCLTISLDTTAPLMQAMRFYERNGFRRSGKVRDFFGMPLFEYVKTLTD